MNALQSAAEPYNTALNQNTPVGQELENIRRGMNYAGTFYDSITRAIARVKQSEQTKSISQDLDTEGLVASIMADVDGASRQTMGQTLQSQIDKDKYPQYDKKEESDRSDNDER